MLTRGLPYLALAGLGLLFFAPLVCHPTQVLYSDYSDILAEHIPAKRFLVRSWQQTGELPLWCPYSYGGSPFIHDIQVAAFYPPHWLLLFLPEDWVGVALSWLIVAHIVLAGWCMFAYARSQGRGLPGAFVAALGFMFAGKWLSHLLGGGHYITIGLAWLPLALLFLERAIRRGSWRDATWAGIVFGLLTLGTQPQWTFYAGLFLALWTLGTALFPENGVAGLSINRSFLVRWLVFGSWTAALALALAAVQFLPTLEAAGQSTRSTGVDAGDLLGGGLRALTGLVGPALTTTPACLMWEDRGSFGLLWLAAAALAPVLGRGKVRYQTAVCVVLFLFAVGGCVLFQGLPGFRLFRQHARMLMIAALPIAFLAGTATDHLLGATAAEPEVLRRCRQVLVRVLLSVALVIGAFALRRSLEGHPPPFHVYWLTLAVTIPAMFWLFEQAGRLSRPHWAFAWSTVLLADLWGLAWPWVAVRPEAEVYARSGCLQYLAEHNEDHGRVLDLDVGSTESPAGTAASTSTPFGSGGPQALLCSLESLRGYNPLDNLRYKEYLQFLGDEDRPLRPLDGPLTFPVISNFPVTNKPLLDLLGTRYLVAPAGEEARVPGDRETEDPAPSSLLLSSGGWRLVAEDESPRAYDFIAGGVRTLPPYRVWENTEALPRAFVVPHAGPLPERSHALQALKATDFRDTVLLEGGPAETNATSGAGRAAVIQDYRPNRVVVCTNEGPHGYLVLTDIWYPGWTCTVDGAPAHLYRGDFLFRAVELPQGAHEVVFTFAPTSYRLGLLISGLALAVALVFGLWPDRLLSPEGAG